MVVGLLVENRSQNTENMKRHLEGDIWCNIVQQRQRDRQTDKRKERISLTPHCAVVIIQPILRSVNIISSPLRPNRLFISANSFSQLKKHTYMVLTHELYIVQFSFAD